MFGPHFEKHGWSCGLLQQAATICSTSPEWLAWLLLLCLVWKCCSLLTTAAVRQIDCCSPLATGKLQHVCGSLLFVSVLRPWSTICTCSPFPQGSDDESYVSDVSDNISEDNASVTDNVSRQSRSGAAPSPLLLFLLRNFRCPFLTQEKISDNKTPTQTFILQHPNTEVRWAHLSPWRRQLTLQGRTVPVASFWLRGFSVGWEGCLSSFPTMK